MRALTAAFVVATAFAASGSSCLTEGIHPLYTAEGRVADPSVVGKWNAVDDKGKPDKLKAVVEQDGADPSYLVTLTSKDEKFPIVFRLVFVDIAGVRYADIVREPILAAKEAKDYADWVVPAHSYGRVDKKDDHLKLSFLEDKWANAADGAQKAGATTFTSTVTTAHDKKSGNTTTTSTILTSDTSSLQAIIQKLPPTAFTAVIEFARAK